MSDRSIQRLSRQIKAWPLCALAAGLLSGCVVGQRPGNGEVLHLQEPTTGGWYYLYLPEDYVKLGKGHLLTGKKWPLVLTCHGMKPFDNASSQIREWQQEADRYGYVVISPELTSPDLLKEFPLRNVHPGVVRDEHLIMGVMNDVLRRVDVDPEEVLSTSWSSGGYIAHYMANRHPERFSCIAPRQSNFSSAVLDPENVPRYRDVKVGIFYTENDFPICRRESQEGAVWYSQHGFDVTLAEFQDLGHERRPGAAAAFFAKTCGAVAKTPPVEIAHMQVRQIPHIAEETTLASARENGAARKDDSGKPRGVEDGAAAGDAARAGAKNRGKGRSQGAVAARPPRAGAAQSRRGVTGPAPVNVTPVTPARERSAPTAPRRRSEPVAQPDSPLQVRVSSTLGIAPLLVNFSALVPGELRRGSFFLWTDNGVPISNGLNGQKYLTTPGDHVLEVLMTTSEGTEYRSSKSVTVLKRVGRSGS